MCNIHQTTVSVSSLDALCGPSLLGIKTGSLHSASGFSLGTQLHSTPAPGFLASVGLSGLHWSVWPPLVSPFQLYLTRRSRP